MNQGWALTRLLGIHAALREDLARLRRAADALADTDRNPEAVTAALADLSIKDPGWSLRSQCAQFCSFVQEHHATEDSVVFPMLLEHSAGANGLGETIERLRADHRALAGHVDAVDQAVVALPGDEAAAAAAINRLATHLEQHLDLEETALAGALHAVSVAIPEDAVPPPPPERYRG
ncbi:MAG TPA: hemerythrin domain-containing protein, partial [Jatrophihabitans sp.]|jgi:iron-sulfur cluster repair protein YtfE (RIC family)|nr:hemerythrin domain-containing protein [Jatrophihabitans sp.]